MSLYLDRTSCVDCANNARLRVMRWSMIIATTTLLLAGDGALLYLSLFDAWLGVHPLYENDKWQRRAALMAGGALAYTVMITTALLWMVKGRRILVAAMLTILGVAVAGTLFHLNASWVHRDQAVRHAER